MAVKVLTVAAAKAFDTGVVVTPETATVAADGFEATIDGDILVLAENVGGAAYTLTFKYGNAMQGVADVVVSVTNGTSKIVKVNTGMFKNLSGTYIGKILLVPEHVDLHVKVIEV